MKNTIILMKASALFMTVSKRLFESCALGISLHMAVGLGFIPYLKSDRIHVNRHPFCLLFYSISPELITGLEPKIPSSVLYSKHLINRQILGRRWHCCWKMMLSGPLVAGKSSCRLLKCFPLLEP